MQVQNAGGVIPCTPAVCFSIKYQINLNINSSSGKLKSELVSPENKSRVLRRDSRGRPQWIDVGWDCINLKNDKNK